MKKPLPRQIAFSNHHTSLQDQVIADVREALDGAAEPYLKAGDAYVNYRFREVTQNEVDAAFKNANAKDPVAFKNAVIEAAEVAIEKQTHMAHRLKEERKAKSGTLIRQ